MILTPEAKKELDNIIKVDYFEFMKSELKLQLKKVNDFPFGYASKQFLLDHYPEKAPVTQNEITRSMFNYWNMHRKGALLSKEVQDGVLAQSTKRKLVDPYGYNSFLYYLAEKYAYKVAQDNFIAYVKSSGIDALKAVEDDFDDYLTCSRYLTNYNQPDQNDTYVIHLMRNTNTLIDFYTYPAEDVVI